MGRVDEHAAFGNYIGERADIGKLAPLAYENGLGKASYADCREYVIALYRFADTEEYRKRFRLTRSLIEKWRKNGISFSVFLYIRDGFVTGGRISKHIGTASPDVLETDATQQEVRVVTRILNYLTLEG